MELGHLFPGDSPAPGAADVTVRCLRPELVAGFYTPLSSDAFCKTGLGECVPAGCTGACVSVGGGGGETRGWLVAHLECGGAGLPGAPVRPLAGCFGF
jgi:hypothetical protein